MPNDWLLRNSSHSCHCDVVGRATSSASSAGAEVPEQPQAVAEQLVEPLDVRVHVGREPRRREPVGDQQVDAGEQRERREEQREQRQLGAEDAPEDVGPAEPVVPQVVDVEAGERPAEHDDEQEERRRRR